MIRGIESCPQSRAAEQERPLIRGYAIARRWLPETVESEVSELEGSWDELGPHLIPGVDNDQSQSVIVPGQIECPRQDSNLRHRLRRPVDR